MIPKSYNNSRVVTHSIPQGTSLKFLHNTTPVLITQYFASYGFRPAKTENLSYTLNNSITENLPFGKNYVSTKNTVHKNVKLKMP